MSSIYESYFKAKSSWYRSFKANCVAALKDAKANNGTINIDLLPPPTEYLASLMGMKNFSEEHLPKEWLALADLNPPLIRLYRRGAAEVRNSNGDEKFLVPLRKDDKYMKKKFLIITNKDYEGGSVPENIKPEHSHKTELGLVPAALKTPTKKPARTPTAKKPQTPAIPKKRNSGGQDVKPKKKAKAAKDEDDSDTDVTVFFAEITDSENEAKQCKDDVPSPAAKSPSQRQPLGGMETQDTEGEGGVDPDVGETQPFHLSAADFPLTIESSCELTLPWINPNGVQALDPDIINELPAVIPNWQPDAIHRDFVLQVRMSRFLNERLWYDLNMLKRFVQGRKEVFEGCFSTIVPRFVCLLGLNPTHKPENFDIRTVKNFITWLQTHNDQLVSRFKSCDPQVRIPSEIDEEVMNQFGEFRVSSFSVFIAQHKLELDGIYDEKVLGRAFDTMRSIETREPSMKAFKALNLFIQDF